MSTYMGQNTLLTLIGNMFMFFQCRHLLDISVAVPDHWIIFSYLYASSAEGLSLFERPKVIKDKGK